MNLNIMMGLVLMGIAISLDWAVPVIVIFTSSHTLGKWLVIFSWIFLATGLGLCIGLKGRRSQWFIQNRKFFVLGLGLLAAIHTLSRIPLVSGSTETIYLICAILYAIAGICLFMAF